MGMERSQIDILFDERGNLRQGMKGDVLFDGTGHINLPVYRALQERMMDSMPLAHTDMARLFYAVEAQNKTERKFPAKFFWK
uniref:Uncharacterized protein n=1 Tax=Pseudomonas phage HRDY3 TaxID=3236930 RepID=A0AB39CEP9_9VIRU